MWATFMRNDRKNGNFCSVTDLCLYAEHSISTAALQAQACMNQVLSNFDNAVAGHLHCFYAVLWLMHLQSWPYVLIGARLRLQDDLVAAFFCGFSDCSALGQHYVDGRTRSADMNMCGRCGIPLERSCVPQGSRHWNARYGSTWQQSYAAADRFRQQQPNAVGARMPIYDRMIVHR